MMGIYDFFLVAALIASILLPIVILVRLILKKKIKKFLLIECACIVLFVVGIMFEPSEDYIIIEEHPATCSEPGYKIGENVLTKELKRYEYPCLPHDFVESSKVEATATSDGKIVYSCSVCGATETKIIAKLKSDDSTNENSQKEVDKKLQPIVAAKEDVLKSKTITEDFKTQFFDLCLDYKKFSKKKALKEEYFETLVDTVSAYIEVLNDNLDADFNKIDSTSSSNELADEFRIKYQPISKGLWEMGGALYQLASNLPDFEPYMNDCGVAINQFVHYWQDIYNHAYVDGNYTKARAAYAAVLAQLYSNDVHAYKVDSYFMIFGDNIVSPKLCEEISKISQALPELKVYSEAKDEYEKQNYAIAELKLDSFLSAYPDSFFATSARELHDALEQSYTVCSRCKGEGSVVCVICKGKGTCKATFSDGTRVTANCDKTQSCAYCGGLGGWYFGDRHPSSGELVLTKSGSIQCPDCKGSGSKLVTWYEYGDWGPTSYSSYTCTSCNGKGTIKGTFTYDYKK